MRQGYTIDYREKLDGCLIELHALLNTCYPRPPQDVFYRLVAYYRPGLPAWTARAESGDLVGFVHLAPNSKGGTLETLAVHPAHRGQGIARALVAQVLAATSGVVSLTTRIPAFFAAQGFQEVCVLPDDSVYMIKIQFNRLPAGPAAGGAP
jgi:GNAT superfamily N-acetyltransferase